MKLYFKQRFFSWFDSYDIYDETGNPIYTVKGQLAWGHCLKIFGANGEEVGTVKEKLITLLPQFELYVGNSYVGCITKELTFFKPRFRIDCNGWQIDGNWMEWDYTIQNSSGMPVAVVTKEVFNWTDTFFKPRFRIDCNGWQIDGNWMEWDYTIQNSSGMPVAVVTKEVFNWTDTYVIDVVNAEDALGVLMVVLAIDAEKCSRSN